MTARSAARWVLLTLIGAAVGTFLDYQHVAFGVLEYPGLHPHAQPYWVPPLFGGATLLFVSSYRAFRSGEEANSKPLAFLYIALFIAAYFASAVFHAHPDILLTAMLLGCAIAIVPLIEKGNILRRALYTLACGLGGALFETFLESRNAFHYIAPGTLPVPYWLPALYFFAALAASQIDLAWFEQRDSSGR